MSHRVRTLWDAFDSASRVYAGHEFLHVPAAVMWGPITLTYIAARSAIEQIVTRLTSAGFEPGHRVALALDNRPEFFLYFLALNRIGCSAVPINAGMSHEELRYVLGHADVAAVIAHESHLQHLQAAVPAGVPLADASQMDGLPSPFGRPTAALEEAALLYTSGTTGTPKGCILTQEYFQQIGRLYTTLGGYCAFRPGVERLITPLPVTHMNALACSLMAMLLTGGCLIQLDRFHPSSWWRAVRESRATCFHYLGVMPAMLLSAPPQIDDDLSDVLRFGFGAGVDPRHHAAFETRFGVPLIEAWAMTETGGAAWITANQEPRHVGQRCFGRAPQGLEWRVVTESGSDAAGEPGELWVRRAGLHPRGSFFSGYYKDEAATAVAWADGWFHTGDIVRVDAEGSFFFVDRLKNVIRRSGENIAAVEIESALLQHPAVQGCAATAVPDEIRGEEVFVFVVPHAGIGRSLVTAQQLQTHCLELLTYFKAPGWIAFVDQLPQTASQKLARGEVKRLAVRSMEDGRIFDLRAGKKRRVSPV